MAQRQHDLYQIKVTLNRAKPPIWRRLVISSDMDLEELHDVLQIAMGWTDSHLHEFIAGTARYGVSDPEFGDGTIPEQDVCVGALLKKEKQWMTYEYDFGDGWEHKIVLEKILPYESGAIVPKCLGGRRECPPEDVGGIWGYVRFLEAYKNKNHPEHEEMLDWAGEDFDPERFDLSGINKILTG